MVDASSWEKLVRSQLFLLFVETFFMIPVHVWTNDWLSWSIFYCFYSACVVFVPIFIKCLSMIHNFCTNCMYEAPSVLKEIEGLSWINKLLCNGKAETEISHYTESFIKSAFSLKNIWWEIILSDIYKYII
jgi:hypothetical protein